MKPRVILVCGAPPERWGKVARQFEDSLWVYFGTDVERFLSVQKYGPKRGELANSGEIINQIAHDIRDEFINFDKHLVLDENEILWQTTDLAEKNPHNSNFFFNCCALVAFDRILGTLDKDFLVYVENLALCRMLAVNARRLGFSTRQIATIPMLDWFPDALTDGLNRIGMLFQAVLRRSRFVFECARTFSLLSKHRSVEKPSTSDVSEQCDVLIFTWAEPDTFPSTGIKQADKYYGELPRLLREAGLRTAYCVFQFPVPIREMLDSARNSQDMVFFPDESWTIKDVIRDAWRTLSAHWTLKSRFVVQDLDLTCALEHELAVEKTKVRQLSALRWYYVGRFLHERGIRPKVLVCLFENQPWEKALRLGVKRFLPETRIVGYMHTLYAPLWLGLQPSDRDIQNSQIPDITVTIGTFWKHLLAQYGWPHEKLRVGPAFRFKHVLDRLENNLDESTKHEATERTILVAASHSYEESIELLNKVILALQDVPHTKVLIKFHPNMYGRESKLIQQILEYQDLKAFPDNFAMTNIPVSELLESADLVIGSGTAVVVEAALFGVKIIQVQSDLWFDMDKLSYFPGLASYARTPEEIRRTVKQLLSENSDTPRDRVVRIRSLIHQIFSPVSEDGARCFVE